ncbi:unnamed protein product [Parnassius apollo]|uniref:(apollo) hypothetical protein n=1 Tax=Parnassius apollo TaxID=110799 RepID=A0A8S3WGH1_PARAO|nr:unnamed protein product [Parnassius apollo]
MRWSQIMNANALRVYFRPKGEETGSLAYRPRMHRFFAELEPSLTVTEQNLAVQVCYILRSKMLGDAELERLRREAVPSSYENAMGMRRHELHSNLTYVDATVDILAVVDSDDYGIVSHELKNNEEHIGRGDVGNAQYASRKSTATSPHTPKQAESGCRAGS